MSFESPDMAKDFPGLYGAQGVTKASDFEEEERPVKKKDVLARRRDLRPEKRGKGYRMFEEEDSEEELMVADDTTKSPSKMKKHSKPSFKFAKREKFYKPKDKDKDKDRDRDSHHLPYRERDKFENKDTCKDKVDGKKKDDKLKWKKRKLLGQGPLGLHLAKSEQRVPQTDTKPVFGVPLAVAVDRSKCHDGILLPVIFRECIDFVEEFGLACEGIYRISGVKSKVQALKDAYNQGVHVYLHEHEPNIVASLLKLYLRELPEPVLTKELMPKFEEASTTKNVKQKVELFQQLIEQLPMPNKLLLSWMIAHMTHVITKEKQNKMSLQNVSIVLSPTMQISHRVLNVLFTYSRILFKDTVIKRYVPPLKPVSSHWSLDLPESPSALEEELRKQESLLSQLHEELMRVKDSDKEEQVWEVQRIVTQLKRKIKLMKKTDTPAAPVVIFKKQQAPLPPSQQKPQQSPQLKKDDIIKEPELTESQTEDKSELDVTDNDTTTKEEQKTESSVPEEVKSTDLSDSEAPSEIKSDDRSTDIVENVPDDVVDNKDTVIDNVASIENEAEEITNDDKKAEEITNDDQKAEEITNDDQKAEDDNIKTEIKEEDSKTQESTDEPAVEEVSKSDELNQEEVEKERTVKDEMKEDTPEAESPLPSSDTLEWEEQEEDIKNLAPLPEDDAPLPDDQDKIDSQVEIVTGEAETELTDRDEQMEKQDDKEGEIENVTVENQKRLSYTSEEEEMEPLKSSDLKSLETSEEDIVPAYDSDDDVDYDTLQQQHNELLLEEEELLLMGDELKQKIETEQSEIERLHQEIAELKFIREDLYDSDDYISSDSSEEYQDDEDLQEILKELVLKNEQLQEENQDLSSKIQQEREICLNVKVQIRMIQQRQLESSGGMLLMDGISESDALIESLL